MQPTDDPKNSQATFFSACHAALLIDRTPWMSKSIETQVVDDVRFIIPYLPKPTPTPAAPSLDQPLRFSRQGLTVSGWEALVTLKCSGLLALECPAIFSNPSINQSMLHSMILHGPPEETPFAIKALVKFAGHFRATPPTSRLMFFRGICFALVASCPTGYSMQQIPSLEIQAFDSLLQRVNSIFGAIQTLKRNEKGIGSQLVLGPLSSFLTAGVAGAMMGPAAGRTALPAVVAILVKVCQLWYMNNPYNHRSEIWTNTGDLIRIRLQKALETSELVTIEKQELATSLARDFVTCWVKEGNTELPWIVQRGKKVPYVPLHEDYRPLLNE